MTTPQIAQGIASLGRNGDSLIMHVTPSEVAGLQAIARANGTSLTINPDTGMPEAFSLGGFFSSLLPTLAGFAGASFGGPAVSPMLAGILAGSATGALTNKKDPLMGALMGGLSGYGGSELFKAATIPAAGTATTKEMIKSVGVDPSLLVPGTAATPSAGVGIDFANIPAGQGVKLAQATNPYQYMGTENIIGTATDPIAKALQYNTPSNFGLDIAKTGSPQVYAGTADLTAGAAGQNTLQKAIGNIQQDPLGFISQNKMGVGMPIGMAALSGLEPSDMGYGDQLGAEEEQRRKYDPNRSLNLNFDTGLRLYAAGGPIAFDDGGVPGSKLNLRREEEQMQNMQPVQQMQPMQQPQQNEQPKTELGLAALNPNAENEVKIEINPNLSPEAQLQQGQQQPMAGRADEQGIPALMKENAGQGNDFEKLYGRTQGAVAPPAMMPMQAMRGFGPDGRRMAMGGTVTQGGMMDLYGTGDADRQPMISSQGYGLGRLSNLAQQQSLAKAETGNYAAGGHLEEGGFVVPADVVSHLGNGSTDAGLAFLAKKYGAKAIKGKGDGMSDDIPTSIEGKQPARVADGEAYIPRRIVQKAGGPKKFYDMMAKVRKARTGKAAQGKQINPHKVA